MPDPSPSAVLVRPWIDPMVEAVGSGPRSAYVEYCWLPVLGPTATWLYRRLGQLVQRNDEVVVDLLELARGLGVRPTASPNGPLARSLVRLEHFGALRQAGGGLLVRRALAPLGTAQLRRLPASLQRSHLLLPRS